MTTDQYVGYVLWIHTGTNAGEYREITANDDTKFTVSPAYTATTDNTSTFRVVKLGYKDETVDGSGTAIQFVRSQPLIILNALSIDDTDITVSNVFQYQDSGKLILGNNAEMGSFLKSDFQQVNMKYVYGVYPLPRIIKRLCVIMASLRTLMAQIAGTYDDFTTVSLPGGFSGSKGEPYVNIINGLDRLQREARGIVYGNETDQLGADFRTGPSYRPFTLFA